MKNVGLFPGSFDPFTKGHEDVVIKALTLFDEVIIAIGVNSKKTYMFDLDKRLKHIESLMVNFPNVRVMTYQKLTVEFCKEVGANFIIRGLRDSKDFEYEKSIAHMNAEISNIETVFLLTTQKFGAINASIVREIFRNNASIEPFVTNSDLLV
jgi:pantetheine-phosphate adenylyltransferase